MSITVCRMLQLSVCCTTLLIPSLRAADSTIRVRLLRGDPYKGNIEQAQDRLSNTDRVLVEVCVDRRAPLFRGRRNPGISFPDARYTGWLNPESVPASLAVWRNGKALRPTDFTMEGESGALSPDQACNTVALQFLVPSEQRRSEEVQFRQELVTLLESGAKSSEDRRQLDLVKTNFEGAMAYFRQLYRENLAGKYAVTATISGVSGKLTFEIEDRPGFYRQLLDKMKKRGSPIQ